jgi:hypothetical protein
VEGCRFRTRKINLNGNVADALGFGLERAANPLLIISAQGGVT